MATKIKMIVTDMDGTFLNDAHGYDHQLFSKTYTRMVTAKIPLVIASGSSYHRLTREFANQVDQLTFISQNGAVVHLGRQLLSVSPNQRPNHRRPSPNHRPLCSGPTSTTGSLRG